MNAREEGDGIVLPIGAVCILIALGGQEVSLGRRIDIQPGNAGAQIALRTEGKGLGRLLIQRNSLPQTLA